MRLVREVGYSRTAGYPTTTWRSGTEKMPSIRRVARAGLPTSHGGFEMFVFYEASYRKDQVALTTGFEPGSLGRPAGGSANGAS